MKNAELKERLTRSTLKLGDLRDKGMINMAHLSTAFLGFLQPNLYLNVGGLVWWAG